jgi:hypothetical protein
MVGGVLRSLLKKSRTLNAIITLFFISCLYGMMEGKNIKK